MENFILAVNVVLPLFLTMSLGYIIKLLGMFDDKSLSTMNSIAFKVFLPILLFYNVYKTNLEGIFNPKVLTFAAISILLMFSILFFIIPLIEKDNKNRGVLIQGIFRSNFVIFGIPVTSSLFGDDKIGIASLLIAIVVPLFNVLSVAALEIFRGGKIEIKKILKGIVTNPLIVASFIGICFLIFGIKLPFAIEKTISDVSKIATPLSLILLGGYFKFSSVGKFPKQLILGVLGKLVLIPAIFLPASIFLGFRGVELASLMVMLASPTAVSSFTMAKQVDANSELAGQIVVFTSTFSVLSVFFWIFILKEFRFI